MLAEKSGAFNAPLFLILSFPKFSELIVSGFQIFLYQVFRSFCFRFSGLIFLKLFAFWA